MGIRGDRKPFINNVSASPEEVDSIRRMKNEKGVNVYYQLVPEQRSSIFPICYSDAFCKRHKK